MVHQHYGTPVDVSRMRKEVTKKVEEALTMEVRAYRYEKLNTKEKPNANEKK